MHITICTLHFAHCTLHIALCSLHFAHCTLHIALCTLHYAHFTMHIALCTLHYAHCTIHIAICTLHYAYYTIHIVICTLHYVYCTMHITLCTMQIALYTFHNAHCTMHIALIRNSTSPTPQHHLQSETNRLLSLPKPASESIDLGRIWRICNIFNNMWASIYSFNLIHKFARPSSLFRQRSLKTTSSQPFQSFAQTF